MPDRRGLGEILREADLINEPQLEEALRLQKVHGERLASILVRQRILTEKFAVTYLGRKIGVPAIDLSKADLDLTLFEQLPLEVCQRHLVLPLRFDGNRLQVAMADPADQKVISAIEFSLGSRISPVVALESSLKHALLEARRAVKAGQRLLTLSPAAALAPETMPASVPAAVAAAARTSSPTAFAPPPPPSPPPPVPQAPIPVAPVHEMASFETLAGAPLSLKLPVSAAGLPPMEALETIIVIDDSEVALKLIEKELKSRGYRVVTAGTGREGLAKMRERLPDLVILDGMLPDVHGFEICQQIKGSERFRHLPVMMLSAVHTGWRFAKDVQQKYGADDYLTKPFDSADLLRRVEALLNKTPSAPPGSEAAVRQHLKAGITALKTERLDEAIASFERGLAVDQFSDMLHYYLAMTFEKKGRVFDAIDHYEKAVQVNPKFFDAITALANLYQRQEFWRKARELWELALDATPDEAVRARIKEHLLSLL